jgi:hypothetical protein
MAPEDDDAPPGTPAFDKVDYIAKRAKELLEKLTPEAQDKADALGLAADTRALFDAGNGRTEAEEQIWKLEHYWHQQHGAPYYFPDPAIKRDSDAAEAAPAPEAETLPSFDSLKRTAESLQRGDVDALQAVIADIAGGHFTRIEEDLLLTAVKQQTGSNYISLKGDLKKSKEMLALFRPSPPRRTPSDWRETLTLGDTGDPRPILANVFTALTCDITWIGVLATDDFTATVMLIAAPPWHKGAFAPRPLTDEDVRKATIWMQQVARIPAASHVVFEGLQAAADNTHFHPVRDYLDSLVWDGTPRLDDLLISYYGALGDPPAESEGEETLKEWTRRYAYHQAVGARFLIGAVARIYQPGCKNDTMPNFVGEQGTLKSSSLRALFDPWFTDEISDLGSKDAAMQAAGVWCIEIGELAAMSKVTVERIKAWLSRSADRFRPPYGRAIKEQRRQSVPAGTTNKDTFLVDETGNRRSWCVRCGVIDIDRLKADRDQLWAEARDRYRWGEKWWLHESKLIATAAEVQTEFTDSHIWTETVLSFAEAKRDSAPEDVAIDDVRRSVSIPEVLAHIGILQQDWTQKHDNEVAHILRKAGWTRRQATIAGKRRWRYFGPRLHQLPDTGAATGAG